MDSGRLLVEVSDDGVGSPAELAAGHGLAGLADRVAALDGTFSVRSQGSSGTTLRAEIPLPGATGQTRTPDEPR